MSFLHTLPGFINGLVSETSNKRQVCIQQENESKNLLVMAKLVLNAFLDIFVRGKRKIDTDTQELVDLLVILEKTLWHGFKTKSRKPLTLKKSDDDLWDALGHFSKNNFSMNETYTCVNSLDNLKSSVTKVRAFLRVAIMKKELADYFQVICSSDLISNYEDWAFLKNEQGSSLAGSLLALRVFDCNLLLDYDVLSELPLNIDLTPYVKLPMLPSQFSGHTEDDSEIEREKTFQVILDQKHYIEEQNRQLTNTLTNVRRKLSENRSLESSSDITRKIDELKDQLEEERNQKNLAMEKYASKRDELKVALDENEALKEQLNATLASLKTKIINENKTLDGNIKNLESNVDSVFADFEEKTKSLDLKLQIISQGVAKKFIEPKEEFYELIGKMEIKQEELIQANKTKSMLVEKLKDLEDEKKKTQSVTQELAELRLTHAQTKQQLEEAEKALEDLGPHLSNSKLQVVTMKEQLLPSSEWVKDSDVTQCLACSIDFTVTTRKHHCRRCGQIFCDSCSNHRINLPSHAKQVRVCSPCFRFLDNLHASNLKNSEVL